MTIPELVERSERRLAELQREIDLLLEGADQGLAATSIGRRRAARAQRSGRQTVPTRASPRRGRGRAAAQRRRKPAAVLALARELDAGLRNRP